MVQCRCLRVWLLPTHFRVRDYQSHPWRRDCDIRSVGRGSETRLGVDAAVSASLPHLDDRAGNPVGTGWKVPASEVGTFGRTDNGYSKEERITGDHHWAHCPAAL